MTGALLFDPLLPWWAIGALAVVVLASAGLALWRGMPGWALRGLGGLVIVLALAQPVLELEDRAPLSDIVLLVEDQSASQQLSDRGALTGAAADALQAQLTARPGTEVRRIAVPDGPQDTGTQVFTALTAALSEEPADRVAGIFVLSDGIAHDTELTPETAPAPVHLLSTGRAEDWDRRLEVRNAPAFAILGEPVALTVRVEDSGAAPGAESTLLEISVDGAEPQQFTVPIGRDLELPITLPHGGLNVIRFAVPEAEGELTDRNNAALVQINGVRDRLRVLLVSGEPHPGGRTWRNLLKSDSSVDLVHFTILRPPEKQDGVPVTELSLIAFPTRELFLDKIDDFDLIVFDRYQRRGILPSIYLDNVRRYVEEGGAVLVAAGPAFAGAESIYRSPLADILPARPTARVVEAPFRATITDLGARHPVTSGLEGPEDWGRWMRQIEVTPERGTTVLSGAEERPLLILDRVGEGRVALLASDQAWLWSRGFEGGGPQLELLRRLAHWMMKEPELEEEALWAEPTGQTMRIIRRTLSEEVGSVTVTRPDGEEEVIALTEAAPGRFEAQYTGPMMGLYRLAEGEQSAVVGLGPAAPREFERVIASDAALAPLMAATRGGSAALADGLPAIREVRPGRPAAGRGWLGITPRDAYQTMSVTRVPFLNPWLVLVLAAGLVLWGWLREGRR